jgi:hypothetical protein
MLCARSTLSLFTIFFSLCLYSSLDPTRQKKKRMKKHSCMQNHVFYGEKSISHLTLCGSESFFDECFLNRTAYSVEKISSHMSRERLLLLKLFLNASSSTSDRNNIMLLNFKCQPLPDTNCFKASKTIKVFSLHIYAFSPRQISPPLPCILENFTHTHTHTFTRSLSMSLFHCRVFGFQLKRRHITFYLER